MAIDTAEKRRSAAGTMIFWSASTTPEVAKDQEWRQQGLRRFSGILAGAGGGEVMVISEWIIRARRRGRR